MANPSDRLAEIKDLYLAASLPDIEGDQKDLDILKVYLNKVANNAKNTDEIKSVFKYKPVAVKVRPVLGTLLDEFRIEREIIGDPLKDMPNLNPITKDFKPTGRYTAERKEIIDKAHTGNFLWPEERRLVHNIMMDFNHAFAWDDTERGRFREDFFPPIKIPVVEHRPWVIRNIPIPPGIYEEVCKIIKRKIEAGVYEPSNSSYRSKWFCVLKKDGKSLRLVHSLEPLNQVTIAHSGLPPATEELADEFAGRSCGGMFDLYVGYDERMLHKDSRDYTTFQTPYGAMRLVTLPMGWTNSVPIFHDDVTHILKEEIPHITKPYIDDVPVKGPKSRYELPDGKYELISTNSGIRRFVWEHLENVCRILQRMAYSGGTFSGTKSVLCAEEITVVGHRCTYEGRKPDLNKVGLITRWGPCKDIHDVNAFLGTVGVCRMFIKDFAKLAEPLNYLKKKNIPFKWEIEQENSMQALKDALSQAPALMPIDYDLDTEVVLSVDTSWRAVGFYISQIHPELDIPKRIARFGSITLNDREARFSQPKRELYGLYRALHECKYWLLGCRKLVVETDASYVKGMLEHPSLGPNASINRWIDSILLYHFTLRHIPGKTFGPDGLSRRDHQPGDDIPRELEEVELDDYVGPLQFEYPDLENEVPGAENFIPLDFESFKHGIDTRGGYYQKYSEIIDAFERDLLQARDYTELEKYNLITVLKDELQNPTEVIDQFVNLPVLPDMELKFDPSRIEPYPDHHRSKGARSQDDRLPVIKQWLKDSTIRPEEMSDKQYKSFVRSARRFFVDQEDRLFRRNNNNSSHRLVIERGNRMFILRSAHDCVGHKGFFATKSLIELRFWWPEMESDINWYVKTCTICQERQKMLIKSPPTLTHTPSLFQTFHCDTMHFSEASNGCKYIVQGRDSLTSWPEGRALRKETGKTVAEWLFEDVICRWGCLQNIVTDNSQVFNSAIHYLQTKYGIQGIKISPYNSQANGKVERMHWDTRQTLYKATGGQANKWFWFYPHVLWAERMTIKKGLGCSPYFAVTGAHPVLPLDIVEATWLVKIPDRALTTEELIGYRARALAKHKDHVDQMRARVQKEKINRLIKYEQDNKHKIKRYIFKPRDLVLIRNKAIESSLDKKMKPRYLGPMVIITRTKGGNYIVAELDGSVFQDQISAARVIPYFACKEINLPQSIENWIDISQESLKALKKQLPKNRDKSDLLFDDIKMTLPESDDEISDLSSESDFEQ
jgi:Integrase zinc binding domain/RNase H-like domain found in reverse transcriptase